MDRSLGLVAVGALAALALVASWAWVWRRWRRWRSLARVRRGHQGEREARQVLERAGWKVLRSHPPGALVLEVGGGPREQPVTADYLCRKGGRVLPAEVKTGDAADPCSRDTRRQLLEYAVAYQSGSTLFVDADQGEVVEVAFPGLGPPRRRWRGAMLCFMAGALAGWLLGVVRLPWP
jgi:Holliday junction resolvase